MYTCATLENENGTNYKETSYGMDHTTIE